LIKRELWLGNHNSLLIKDIGAVTSRRSAKGEASAALPQP